MDIDKIAEAACNSIAQDISYKFGDLIMSYPPPIRTVAIAVVQSCITAQLSTMPEREKRTFEAVSRNMTVTLVPSVLDPRKFGGEKDGKG